MAEQERTARYMSTPMIKGELQALLRDLAPEKWWPKSARLKDLIAFTIQRIDAANASPKERRALELALVIHHRERR